MPTSPYYADDFVTIYHGAFQNSLIVMPPCDAIITDPPYGETSLDWDRWLDDWPYMLHDVAPAMWCFGSMRMFIEHADEFASWKFSQDVVWEKHNGSCFHADRFRRVHEHATFWYRGEWAGIYHEPPVTMDATKRTVRAKARPPHTGDIERIPYQSEDGGPRLMTSVMRVRSMHGAAEHPTQKPVGIVRPLIEYACPVGGTVLDPFLGSGTTAVAAKLSRRKCIGFEVQERYCEVAAKRCAQDVLDFGAAS